MDIHKDILSPYKETHFYSILAQGNIYTFKSITLANGSNKILLASLKRELHLLEFIQDADGTLVPTSKEISFTYMPIGCEIISIDAFNKSSTRNEFVIGITIVKSKSDMDATIESYLNIYSEWEESDYFSLENIAQSCITVDLNYIPGHLTHCDFFVYEQGRLVKKGIVFVLCGGNNQVHVYQEVTLDHFCYKQVENKQFFPECTKFFPSPIVWVDIMYIKNNTERLFVFGCECGYFRLTKVGIRQMRILFNFSARLDHFITKVMLYVDNEPKTELVVKEDTIEFVTSPKEEPIINLLVVNAILPTIIFKNILKYALTDYFPLPRTCFKSFITCCEFADVDLDGRKELLMGNCDNEIIVFKQDETKDWYIEDSMRIAFPVVSVKYTDLTGDKIKEIVILSRKGVHILQHDFEHVQKILNEKIRKLIQ